ncbi:KilA-N domain-containing protein [Pseudomonas taeanensis]|uniref:KilA-N domain-containing protein n=1 Tax=Pseudomonas taeanensis TaxID=574962 RepID=UPI000687C560|nr:KilA-N domain-containing protein [Pseudomonas taeanensis]
MTTAIITRDYNGQTFSFREDGYFNMTKAAKAFGKRMDNFFANDGTAEYVNELEKLVPGIPVINTKTGNGKSPMVGTWGHPKLAVFFARWLDVKFAVFCDTVIDDILSKKAKVEFAPEAAAPKLAPTHLDTARELVAALEQAEKLAQENQKLTAENKEMAQELNFLTVDEYRALSHLYLSHSDRIKLSKYAKGYSLSQGVEVTKQSRFLPAIGREVQVNVYTREALDHAALLMGLI